MLGDYLFTLGGMVNTTKWASSIESLNLQSMQSWSTIVESNQHVERRNAAIAAITATKIIVFGGYASSGHRSNDGYIFDTSDNNI